MALTESDEKRWERRWAASANTWDRIEQKVDEILARLTTPAEEV